jgi:hypothetical protein
MFQKGYKDILESSKSLNDIEDDPMTLEGLNTKKIRRGISKRFF